VNRAGKFNVPFGRYAKPAICDEENLRACSAALADVELVAADFETAASRAVAGDFVYFDPPYVPLSRTAAFTAYAPGGFDLDAQSRLAALFGKLAERGVAVLLSNSDVPAIRKLYARYRMDTIEATRVINCKAMLRGPVRELLVHHVGTAADGRTNPRKRPPRTERRPAAGRDERPRGSRGAL
jgi:DNA adenine methylase